MAKIVSAESFEQKVLMKEVRRVESELTSIRRRYNNALEQRKQYEIAKENAFNRSRDAGGIVLEEGSIEKLIYNTAQKEIEREGCSADYWETKMGEVNATLEKLYQRLPTK